MKKKAFDLLTLGEILLRLSTPINGRLAQGDTLMKHLGGAELNIASEIGQLGLKTAMISKIPNNLLAAFIKNQMNASRVSENYLISDTADDSRIGVYYYEYGSYPRKPRVEVAWQAHFVTNMFIRPTAEELEAYGEPDFVCFNASKAKVDNYKELGLNSETATVFNLKTKEQVILNTWYGGEMKKGMFSIMNYMNPLRGIASMHCSANTNMEGTSSAIFFGLSGTGKTTLSTDPKRKLIGDDEHGWDDEGVFNYEGGCYAKVINLDKESEPDIYAAIKRDALLENVTVDANGKIDFADKSVTENTRVSYPIYHIENIVKPISKGPHAQQVIFLSADAFGVLPPVSILNPEQAQYYFLSGFTAKLAGTERGITEPTPTFSACFGAAFLSLHPTKYAEELVKKMEKTGAKAYLVNTGWNGTGKRISIRDTRGIIDAILDGSIDKAPTKVIPYFDFVVPTELPGVDPKILDPRDTYADAAQWDEKAKDLAGRFIKNFAKFTGNEAGKKLVAAGPKL